MHLMDFPPGFTREARFSTPVPFRKWSNQTGENAPKGSQTFPFRIDPFSEGRRN